MSGPVRRPQRNRQKPTPYIDPKSATLNAAADARKAKLGFQATLLPIPINLTFDGDSSSAVTILDHYQFGPVAEEDIVKNMKKWKYINSFANGFGTVTPPRVEWKAIESVMVPKITDGMPLKGRNFWFRDGHYLFKVDGHPAPHTVLEKVIKVAGTHEDIVDDYAAACQRGDASFEIKIKSVWECSHRGNLVCFGGDSKVLMANGSHKLVRDLGVGEQVAVPSEGITKVTAVWCAQVGRVIPMVSINGVLLTPDHPVCVNGAWKKAIEIGAPTEMYMDAVYNFALTSSHSLWVRGGHSDEYVHCCTLGKPVPGIPEPLWGSNKIFKAMRAMPGYPNVVTVA